MDMEEKRLWAQGRIGKDNSGLLHHVFHVLGFFSTTTHFLKQNRLITLTRLGTMKKKRIESFKQELEEYKYDFLFEFGLWYRKWRHKGGMDLVEDLNYYI